MKKLLITATLLLLSLKPLFAGVAKGVDVGEVQTILTELCFNVGPIDGVWGKKTEKAAEEFFTKYFKEYDGTFGGQEFYHLKASSRSKKVGGQKVDSCSPLKTTNSKKASVGEIHKKLHRKHNKIRFGTPADTKMITLGPTKLPKYFKDMPPYKGKTSLNIKMPRETKVLAPMDMQFIGYKNRNAEFRKTSQGTLRPFDDLELCFKSVEENPSVIMCAYHLKHSPLLPKMFKNTDCNVRKDWDVGDASVSKAGLVFYETNTSEYFYNGSSSDNCGAVLGQIIKRGDIIGYSGTVGKNPHTGFRFKVRHTKRNPLSSTNKIYDVRFHWVQPSIFFDWACFKQNKTYEAHIMTYPFDCDDA